MTWSGLVGAILAVLFAGQVQAAVVWNVVQNSSCTAVNAATVNSQASVTANCCTGASAGFCLDRQNAGNRFQVRNIDLVATGTYTANGDALIDAAALNTIGLNTITELDCRIADTGVTNAVAVLPVLRRASSTGYTVMLYTQTTTASAIVFSQVAGSIAGYTLHCDAIGY